jgi:hypothetical protein
MEAVMSITQNVQTEFIKTGNKCGTLTWNSRDMIGSISNGSFVGKQI